MSQTPQPQRASDLDNLREHLIQRPAVAAAKIIQRPVIRCRPRRQIAKRQVFLDSLLQTARRRDSQNIRVQPHLQQQSRMIGRAPFFHITRLERAPVQPLDGVVQEKTNVVFPQHLSHAGRQQIGLFRVVCQKFHRASLRRII